MPEEWHYEKKRSQTKARDEGPVVSDPSFLLVMVSIALFLTVFAIVYPLYF